MNGMKKITRTVSLCAAILLTLLCGCGEKTKTNVEFPSAMESVASKTVAENAKLSLEWDEKEHNLILRDKSSGKAWYTSPNNGMVADKKSENLASPVYIEYINGTNLTKETAMVYSKAVATGRTSVTASDSGIDFVYYFDEIGISVPVSYILHDESLAVTVDFSKATEKNNQLLSVSVAPFLCSVKNNTDNAYLLVPTGSGAIMKTDERLEGERHYTGIIYGDDPASLIPENLNNDEPVRLPVFGVKSGDNAIFGIVEEGDNSAYITAESGNSAIGYSNVYVSFYARGYDITDVSDNLVGTVRNNIYQVAKNIDSRKATVAFYSLNGEKASYIGMAEKYRDYLKSEGFLNETYSEKQYALYITGGAQIKELVMGFGVSKTKALTTFSQAEDILKAFSEETKITPSVQLLGFGKSGLTPGKVAGGFGFSSVFGKNSERMSLENYCSENNIPVYTDFDLTYFSKSGNGFNSLLDTSKSAMKRKISLYYKDKALWNFDKTSEAHYLLRRSSLQKAVDKLEKTVKNKKISGVSLSTLGSVAYSDYSKPEYYSRISAVSDAQKYIKQLSGNGTKIATQSANAYAAVLSDSVFGVPTDNGGYTAFDAAVPFYQMVFKGYIPLYSTSVNVMENTDKAVMLAAQSGISPGFSIVGKYDPKFSETAFPDLNASDYESNKSTVIDTVSNNKNYYEAINGQEIIGYDFLNDGITKTTFANGTVCYANHSDKSVQSPVGELKPYGFSFTSEVSR